MSAVFYVILKENLRKMQRADLGKILDVATGTGHTKNIADMAHRGLC